MISTKEMAVIMMEAGLGQRVQSRPSTNINLKNIHPWANDDFPSWNWADMEYRIKPKEPREYYIVYCSSNPLIPRVIEVNDGLIPVDAFNIIYVREIEEGKQS